MSTRSRIGILKKDGSIDSIYCHLDGYPEWVGAKLYQKYNNVDKINRLIELGDISHLEDNLEPDPTKIHQFGHDTEQKNVVVAYHRDRNENWEYTKPHHFNNMKEFKTFCKHSDQEFAYLYDEENKKYIWSPIPWHEESEMKFKDLEDKLIILGIVNPDEKDFDNLVWKVIDFEKDNDFYEFQDEYVSDDIAFDSLKRYFIENGFDDYKNSLKDNIMYLEEDKNDKELGKLYNKANELLKDIEDYTKDNDLEL